MSFITAREMASTARKYAFGNGESSDRLAQDHWRDAAGEARTFGPISGTGSAYGIDTLENTGAASVAFSPDQTRIYVARYDGKLDIFDAASHAKLATWNVGTSLGGLSLSENGDFLLVVERFTQPGPFSPPGPPPSSTFYSVDTTTGAVTTYTRPGGAYLDVEVVDGHKAILTGGQQEASVFDLTNHSYTALPGAVYYSNSSVIVEDERYTLFAEQGISNGPLMLYDDQTGTIVAHGDNYQTIGASSGSTGFNFGHQAISEASGLVAQFAYYNTVNLFDLQLHFLRGLTLSGPVDGLAFDITGKFLFARSNTQLNLIDISNGAIVETFAVGPSSWHNNPGSGDQIVLSADGKTILVKDNSAGGLQIIDLHLRDELFQGTVGADSFAGGQGDDIYIVNHSGDTITELLYDGVDLAIASVDYTIGVYVENLRLSDEATRGTGNELDNRIEGTAAANLLQGLGGIDQLYGGGGDDVLEGGAGADLLDGGAGADTMRGGSDNDFYYVDSGNDVVVENANEGNDRVFSSVSYALAAGASVEMLTTDFSPGTAAINLTGNELANAIFGNDGANSLDGGAGADTLVGRLGDDFYYVDNMGDVIVESVGQGTDRVFASTSYALGAGASVELFTTDFDAGTTAINLTGNELANTIFGNDGANVLNGGAGADTLVGRSGDDFYYVDHAGDVVIESAGQGTDRIFASVSYTLAAGADVELLTTDFNAGTSAINLSGNALANTIYGNDGANILDGAAGADTLVGRSGDDSYYVDNAGDVVIETAGQGNDRIFASASYRLADGVSVELLTTDFNPGTAAINLTGNAAANVIYGNDGANILDGAGGADVLVGRSGDDFYYVDNATDLVLENAGQGTDRVFASVSYTLAAGQDVELLTTDFNPGTAAINLSGNELANTIFGNDGANILDGRAGADTLVGRLGDDWYFIDNVGDAIVESAGQGNDRIFASTSYTLGAGVEVEVMTTDFNAGTGAINLTGNELANIIYGNDGANILDGKAGSDVLVGLSGADGFAFTTALGATNVDTIIGFVSGSDRLQLDDAIFTALGAPGTLNANAFVAGSAAGDSDDRIIYDSANGQLFYDADGNGAGAAILFATLSGNPVLVASDFQVI